MIIFPMFAHIMSTTNKSSIYPTESPKSPWKEPLTDSQRRKMYRYVNKGPTVVDIRINIKATLTRLTDDLSLVRLNRYSNKIESQT